MVIANSCPMRACGIIVNYIVKQRGDENKEKSSTGEMTTSVLDLALKGFTKISENLAIFLFE